MLSFKNLLAAGCLTVATMAPFAANATTFLTFSQTGVDDIVTATATGGSSTTISVTNGSVSIGSIDAPGISTPAAAYLTLTATSNGSATTLGSYVYQSFSGSFSISSGTDDSGTVYLSGTFNDAAGSGKAGAFALSASQPPANEVNVTSDVIGGADLAEQLALSFSFTNVNPQVLIDGSTLAGFTSNISGTFSGSYATPEPASLALLMVGLGGIGFLRRRRA